MVVPMPAWTGRCLDLQNGIDDAQRIDDQRIVGAANAVSHELKKSGIDDLLRGIAPRLAGRDVRQGQPALIGILNRTRIVDVDRMNADVMALDVGRKRT